MKRTITIQLKAATTLALACTTALVLAVATVQARPAHTARSRTASAAPSLCTTVVTGAPWHEREAGKTRAAGNEYAVSAGGISCSSAGAMVVAMTHRQGMAYGQAFKGPRGFACKSLALPQLGVMQAAGKCMHLPHNYPIFSWSPKLSSR
ncbi:MAG TPA: hypothetical protein VFA66_07295 [Gaiellaceae bacterium]|nr:hypothetical protein [Gaiellaceae bacterium]